VVSLWLNCMHPCVWLKHLLIMMRDADGLWSEQHWVCVALNDGRHVFTGRWAIGRKEPRTKCRGDRTVDGMKEMLFGQYV